MNREDTYNSITNEYMEALISALKDRVPEETFEFSATIPLRDANGSVCAGAKIEYTADNIILTVEDGQRKTLEARDSAQLLALNQDALFTSFISILDKNRKTADQYIQLLSHAIEQLRPTK